MRDAGCVMRKKSKNVQSVILTFHFSYGKRTPHHASRTTHNLFFLHTKADFVIAKDWFAG
jgi:hypothetical protein